MTISDNLSDTESASLTTVQPKPPPSVEKKKKVSFAEEPDKVSRDFSTSGLSLQAVVKNLLIPTRAEADLVLRSSDGVAFHVFSQILAEASSVFNDMIALGAAHALAAKAEGKDEVAIVDVAEDASVVDSLLRLIYPIRNPPLPTSADSVDTTLDSLVQLLKAADKYQMEGVLWSLKEALIHRNILRRAPVRVYTIACMFGLEEEARLASQHTLSVDVLQTPLFRELSQISARDYIRLVQLQQNRASAAIAILQSATPTCVGCSKERDAGPLWWTEFKDKASCELRQRPNTDVVFTAGFLARCVMDSKGMCSHCPLSYLSIATQARLEHMKERIDTLPSMVESLS